MVEFEGHVAALLAARRGGGGGDGGVLRLLHAVGFALQVLLLLSGRGEGGRRGGGRGREGGRGAGVAVEGGSGVEGGGGRGSRARGGREERIDGLRGGSGLGEDEGGGIGGGRGDGRRGDRGLEGRIGLAGTELVREQAEIEEELASMLDGDVEMARVGAGHLLADEELERGQALVDGRALAANLQGRVRGMG